MKILYLLLACCFAIPINSFCQDSHLNNPFTVELKVGAAFQQNGSSGGVFEFNPTVTFGTHYRAGLQFEFAGFNENEVTSYKATFDYLFIAKTELRLFVGAGYGFSNNSVIGNPSSLPPEESLNYKSFGNMGGNLRIGLEWHRISLGIAYYISSNLSKTSTYYTSRSSNAYTSYTALYSGNYFSSTIGIRIGGGRGK